MKTLANQYKLIKEGKGHKGVFLKEAKAKFPGLITNASTFNEASTILKQKGIISENFVGMPMVGNPLERKKEGYETAFANFLKEAEAKAESKTPAKNVKETDDHNYNYKDKKDPNNMIFGQIQMGYYYEMKQEKNADKTIDEIKDIVFKNLAKDPIYYTKNGQFGEDVGYTEDNISLGVPKEAKGKYKESGYGNLNEHSITLAGGIVTGGGFTSQNYMDFYGLNEENVEEVDNKTLTDLTKRAEKGDTDATTELAAAMALRGQGLEEDVSKEEEYFEALTNAAEKLKEEENLSVDKIISMLENHLNLRYRDQED